MGIYLCILFSLHAVALHTSMAAMEIFNGLFLITAVILGWLVIRDGMPAQGSAQTSTNNKFVLYFDRYFLSLKQFKWVVFGIGFYLCAVIATALVQPSSQINWGDRFAMISTMRWIYLFLLVVVVARIGDSKKWLESEKLAETLLLVFAIVGSVVASYSILHAFTGVDWIRGRTIQPSTIANTLIWRARGFFANPMAYTYSVASILPLVLAGFWIGTGFTKTKRYGLLLASVLCGLGLFFTFSRGAWLGFVVMVPVMAYAVSKKFGHKMVFAMSAILLISYLAVPQFRDRVNSAFNENGNSISQRWDLWESNLVMFQDHFLFGVGVNRSRPMVQRYHEERMGREGFVQNPHNQMLQVASETGIFGLLGWVTFFVGMFLVSWRAFQNSQNMWVKIWALGAIGAQVNFHVGGLTQSIFMDKEPMYLFVTILAVSLSLIAQRDRLR
jgi:O-antigen ligase